MYTSGFEEARTVRMSKTVRPIILFLALTLAVGCATAHNYLDPAGPRYQATLAPPVASHPADQMRVVTFNIKYGRQVDRATQALRTHAALQRPDVLLLQEMDADGVERMARALGLNYVYFPASRHPKTGRDFGNAVLSPWPIERGWKVPLPHHARLIHQARAAVAARVRVAGRPVRVYSVHFGSPLGISGVQRRAQAEAVLADAATSLDPVVLAGDLNSKVVGRVFQAARFDWPTRDVGRTIGLFSYDHVFTRGLPTRASMVGVARDVDASDHRPVWVQLPL
jgi:endonuclease/exonuclease/phosphatase family metal-dependent hydrolase